MNDFSEDKMIEQTAIRLFGDLWGAKNHINAFSDAGDAVLGRDNQGQVVLVNRLMPALKKLNPYAPDEAIVQAVEQLTRDRSTMSIVNANLEIYKMLKDGVRVDIHDEHGALKTINLKVVDFDNSDNNDFLLVSQLWITGELHKRRTDLVGFVNGLPLVLIELKASHKNLRNAYQENIRDYKDTIPQIFWYNAFIIISNGIESKVGTVTSAYEFFNEWKKVKDEEEVGKVSLETIINGTCEPGRLLDIVENYILFDDSRSERIKILARYFQFLGVNRAFDRVQNRNGSKGKLGVFWHTQGSGKSYSMVFLSQKVFRKLHGNYTFVIVTDRKELDKQIYKTFAATGAVYEDELHADSISDLKKLLGEDHRHVFTLIHKFQEPTELNTREDIIVMVDEAHRTQYDRLASNMRISLPNASFVGFTGTPLMAGEEKTRATFGDYISTYNFAQSVEDGATVPLFYENRVPHLKNENVDIEKDIEKVMDYYDLNVEEEEKLEQEFSTFYHLITREDRLNKIAEDIVHHFTSRGYDGKAMVVSIDKKTAFRMYTKVQEQMKRYVSKLKIDLTKASDEREEEQIRVKIKEYEGIDMAVIVSQSQNEIADMNEFEIDVRPLRARMINEDLETKFKDPESNLRIVFVCAMWITGFDVLNLSTLYLDKPLKNHTLMQTIARTNRVYPGKKNGLIVDYIGVFRNLQKALSIYATPEGGASIDDIIQDKEELVEILVASVEKARTFLKSLDLDIKNLIDAEDVEKIRLVDVFTNRVIDDEKKKKVYLDLASDAYNYYQSVLPEPRAEDYYKEVTAYKAIATRIREAIDKEADVGQVKKDLEDLLDRSIRAGEFVIKDINKIRDLSKIDFNALRKFFDETENKNIAAQELSAELNQKIQDMMKKNKARKRFLERLNKLLSEYNTGSRDLGEFFNQLMALAKDLSEEDSRTIKENLTEEELAIFDILRKDKLNPDEEVQVKKVAKELLATLKAEKLVLDWKKREETRADVKVTIQKTLYDGLPEPTYDEKECEDKTQKVYHHVYDSYIDNKISVYL